jgi:predicted secreted Zn-dependent protease
MKVLFLALFALLLVTPAIAQPNVDLDEVVKYYDVRGMTEDAIASSLRRDAPRDIDGFQGQTDFYFSWTYDYGQVGERGSRTCRVHDAHAKVEITITLPRHRTISRAPDTVRRTWTTFAGALEGHERNHAKDFARIGSQIPDALDGLTGPCDRIEEIANAKGMDYVDLAQQSADDYDAATNHGETEGTFFPGI